MLQKNEGGIPVVFRKRAKCGVWEGRKVCAQGKSRINLLVGKVWRVGKMNLREARVFVSEKPCERKGPCP